MENNESKGAVAKLHAPFIFSEKKLISSLLLLFLFISPKISEAQNISKHFTSSIQDKGTLYFIYPMKGFKNTVNSNRFLFDITSVNSQDSVIINFSYFDSEKLQIESFYLENSELKIEMIPKKIFVEKYKSKWHYRYKVHVKNTDLITFYSNSLFPTIHLVCKENKHKSLTINKRAWKKQSELINRVFEIQEMNK